MQPYMKSLKIGHDYVIKKKEENITFFNKWSKSYDAFIFSWWMEHLQDEVLEEVPNNFNGKILDVGCATGSLLARFGKRTRGKLSGVDISPEMIKKAKLKLRVMPRIKLHLADAERLPFKSNSFDYVVSTLIIHHLPNPLLAIKEMCRVLRKNGRLIVVDSNFFLSVTNYFAKLIEPGFVRMYSKKEFKQLVEMAGMLLLKQKRTGIFAILNVAVKP